MVPSTGFEPVSRRLQRHVLTTITTMAMAREERFERSVTGLEPIGLPLNRFSRGPGSQTRTEKKTASKAGGFTNFPNPGWGG